MLIVNRLLLSHHLLSTVMFSLCLSCLLWTGLMLLTHQMLFCACLIPDIQFWRSRKSLEGLSVRSVFFNVFQSLVVVLYVFDNETNTVVKISVVIGLLIEIWKIHKVVNVKVSSMLYLYLCVNYPYHSQEGFVGYYNCINQILFPMFVFDDITAVMSTSLMSLSLFWTM